jgi:hypothetical protein
MILDRINPARRETGKEVFQDFFDLKIAWDQRNAFREALSPVIYGRIIGNSP